MFVHVKFQNKCIKQLKPPYRDIIIAVDIEGYTYKEISNELGISIGTSKSNLSKAKGNLKKALMKYVKTKSLKKLQ